MGDRITRALGLLPASFEPGHPRPSQIAGDLTSAFRADCGPGERLFLTVAAAESLESEDRAKVALGIDPFPYGGDDPFREQTRQRCVDAYLELPTHDRHEFLEMARRLA